MSQTKVTITEGHNYPSDFVIPGLVMGELWLPELILW